MRPPTTEGCKGSFYYDHALIVCSDTFSTGEETERSLTQETEGLKECDQDSITSRLCQPVWQALSLRGYLSSPKLQQGLYPSEAQQSIPTFRSHLHMPGPPTWPPMKAEHSPGSAPRLPAPLLHSKI